MDDDAAPGERKRLAVLRSYEILDAPREQQFDAVTALAAHICQTPMAAITLIDRNRQWIVASHGLTIRETPRSDSICRYLIADPRPMVVPDTAHDPRFADSTLVTGETGIRFYAGSPLITDGGDALGALCVLDREPRELSAEQQYALQLLSRHVMAQLDVRRHSREMDSVNRALLSIVEDEQHAQAAALLSEKKLRISNDRFQAVVSATNDAVRDWNLHTGAMWWSRGAERSSVSPLPKPIPG